MTFITQLLQQGIKTERQGDSYIPPTLFVSGVMKDQSPQTILLSFKCAILLNQNCTHLVQLQTHLIIVSSIADTLHGTRVVVGTVVKLTHWFMAVDLVQYWG